MARLEPLMPYDKLLNELYEMEEYEAAKEVEEWENLKGKHGGFDGWFAGEYTELEIGCAGDSGKRIRTMINKTKQLRLELLFSCV